MTLTELRNLIEDEIVRLPLPKEPKNLFDPIQYLLALGGKRMRPTLVLLGYMLQKEDPTPVIREALSVEVFHNFTLMHDDIMDKAPLRRGEPTVHKKWNETIAILSGDAMLIEAYNLLLGIDPAQLPRVLKNFNQCATDVCAGQQLDMDFESRSDVREEEYLDMIRLKTAVLLGWSLQLGGILSGADEKKQQNLYDLGVSLGMAFQLMDDYLDTFGDPDTFGKQIGGDILANKKTFLLLNALKHASGEDKDQLVHWLAASEYDSTKKVEEVTQIYRNTKTDQLTREKILAYEATASKLLLEYPGREEAKALLGSYFKKLKERVA